MPLFEDLGGGKAQLVHLSYQELFAGEFMVADVTFTEVDAKSEPPDKTGNLPLLSKQTLNRFRGQAAPRGR